MYYLFTTPWCHKCPEAKKITGNNSLVVIKDATQPANHELAKKYGISSVPALIEVDKHENKIKSHIGIDEIKKIALH